MSTATSEAASTPTVEAASTSGDIGSAEDEAARPLDVFTEHLAEALAAAQAEVIAAKVPISGYGRVKDSFDHLKPLIVQLTSQLVASELASLRAASDAALAAQRAQLSQQHELEHGSQISAIAAERDRLVAAAVEACEVAEAEAKVFKEQYETVLHRRDGAQDLIEELEASVAEEKGKLENEQARVAKLEEKLGRLEGRLKAVAEEWEAELGSVLEGCTLKTKREKGAELKDRASSRSKGTTAGTGGGALSAAGGKDAMYKWAEQQKMMLELGMYYDYPFDERFIHISTPGDVENVKEFLQ